MKRITILSLCATVLLIAFALSTASAQVSGLTFSQSSGTYTPISGGTVLGNTSIDDQYFVDPAVPLGGTTATGPGFPIGFSFTYNGHTFDQFGVQANGWIALGSSSLSPAVDMSTTSSYTPLSSTAANVPDYLRSRIAGLGRDLQAQASPASQLMFQTTGSAGSRVLVVQWTSYKKYGTSGAGDDFSFQIRLSETSNRVDIVYGTMTSNSTSTTVQVGLGGTTSTDFNNRTTTTNWSATTTGTLNSDACTLVNTVAPPSGLTFTWQDVTQTYTSSTVTQNTNPVLAGAAGAQIIGIQVVMTGSVSPLSATSFSLNTNGTTNTSDISNAKLFYTGTSPVFGTSTQFGSTVPVPGASFVVSGSQALSNGTNYFWLTYDINGGATPGHLIDGECTSLTVGSARTPTITAPAGARTVVAPLSGTRTVGTAGDYATLIDAANAINNIGLGGNLTLNVISDLTDTAVVISQWAEAGAGGYRLTIKPSGAPRMISGNSGTAVIKLNGADRVTIDGSTSGGTDRSLTITNANTTALTAVIQVASLGTGLGATDNIIKNCNLATGTNATTTYGVCAGGPTIGSTGDDNDNLTIQNNVITKAYYGIYAVASATGLNDNLSILQNSIGSNTLAEQIGYCGVSVSYGTGGLISQNTIYKVGVGTISTPVGIQVQTGFVSATISRNLIDNITYNGTSGYGGRGIFVSTGSATSNLTIVNNVIYQIGGDGWTTFAGSSMVGMYFDGTTGGLNIYYNSVYMSGTFARSSATLTTAILFNTTTITGVDVRDNIFQNSMNNTAGVGAKNYAIYSTAPSTSFTNIDRNDYYTTGTQGVLGFLTADQTTITAWRTATGQDANSINADPTFSDVNDLRLYLGSPALAAGVSVPGITIDYLGVTRGTPPSMGAYEVGLSVGKPNPAVVASPAIGDTTVARNATLNWISGGGQPTGYKLSFGTDNPPTNILNNSDLGNVLSYAPSSAMAYNTTYYWKVVAYNSHGDTTGTIWSFRTMHDPTVNSFPFAEGFESTSFPPVGWTSTALSGTYNWVQVSAGVYPPQLPYSGAGEARYQSFSASAGMNARMVTPPLNIPSGMEVKFQMYQDPGYPSSLDSVAVEVTTDGGTTWTSLGSYQRYAATAGWQAHRIPLTGYTGIINVGFHAWSQYGNDLYLDSVVVGAPTAIDMAMTSWYQSSGLPSPTLSSTPIFAPVKSKAEKEASPFVTLSHQSHGGVASRENASVSKGVVNQFDNINYLPISLKGVASNLGVNATTWALNWSVEGIPQTPVSRPSVPSGGVDTATASYTSSLPGTFYAIGKAVAAGDGDNTNDSLGTRIRIYPDSFNRTILDRGDDVVDTYIGWGVTTTQMKAGVRFTASATRKLAGVDFVTRSETGSSTGVWQVQVCAAGVADTVPGAVLYTRTYSGLAYNAPDGAYITFAFDASAPTITSGTTYWITVKAPLGISYPGAAHNTGFVPGHSFYESDTDTTLWSPLIITTERAWIMRSYDVDAATTVNVNTSIANGWNMISNPVTSAVPDDSAKHLFPTIISRAFEFVPGGGYQGRDTMGNRKGYWGKFPGATTNLMTGLPRTRDTISVVAGWNMVGSISNTVDTATIGQIPAGIKASNWFGFVAGYAATSPIVPGKAYWVKVNATGKFVFANPLGVAPAKAQAGSVSPLDALNTLTITDSRGGSQTLYFGADAKNEIQLPLFDMPPAPPVGVLDARFETVSGGSMVQTHQLRVSGPVSFPVKIQSDAYPVTVTWKINGGTASYQMTDGVGGRVFRAKEMTAEGSIKITSSDANRVVVNLMSDGTLPAEYALSQNYPNPFNPTTSIKYALPVQSRVTMHIYNVLGQNVRTLVNDDMPAGYQAVVWDGTGNRGQQLASGTYFLQLSAQGTNGKTFNEMRKLLLLK